MTLQWFSGDLLPALGPSSQALLVRGYGVLLAFTLLFIWPRRRWFLTTERWGGYADPGPALDAVLRPPVVDVVLAAWLACAVALAAGRSVLVASTVSLLLCRFFFVDQRWRSATRGFGAPGFMTYWIGGAVCLLAWVEAVAPNWKGLALLTLQADYALIMLSAGAYKWRAGYRRGDGMQLGLANPQWSYWARIYLTWPPQHWIFRAMNQLAWSVEIAGAILMLVPATRQIGALAIIFSFAFTATQIRLGTLCWIVMLGGLLFFHPGSAGDWVAGLIVAPLPSGWAWAPAGLAAVLAPLVPLALGAYLALLPLIHLGLSINLYGRRRLTRWLQSALETCANLFGIIVWRVFSADHTNFFVSVFVEDDGRRRELTRWGWPPWGRFNFVGESIVLTSLVMLRRYYPADAARFHARLVRVARTMPCQSGGRVVFRVVLLDQAPDRFRLVDTIEYVVNPVNGDTETRILDTTRAVEALSAQSPVHPAARPGTYAPAGS